MGNYIGIIDLGSNSARLVIYYLDQQGLMYEFDNFKQVLRLSEHIQADRNIDQEGFRKTLACMQQFKEICQIRGVNEIIAVATAAVRQANNGQALLQTIREDIGVPIRLLTGEEEANCGYLAVVNTMDIKHAVAVDIGGGSTEITLIKNREKINSISFPFGAVSLTKRFFTEDIPTTKELQQVKEYMKQEFAKHPWLKNQKYPLVAIGGTARNLAKIHQRKRSYPLSSLHTYVMKTEDVEEIFDLVSQLPIESRVEINGLSKDRVDIIPSGLFVFKTLMEWVQSKELIISNKGLRDGILFDKVLKEKNIPYFEDVAMFSVEQFMNRYDVNKPHAYHVSRLAKKLFDELNRLEILTLKAKEKKLLKAAALLHDIGRSINVYNTSQHTFYLITNVLLMGISQRERLLIAFVASYKNDKLVKTKITDYMEILTKEDEVLINQLGPILLLARSLDRSMSQSVKKIKLEKKNRKITVECNGSHHLIECQFAEELMQKLYKGFKYRFSLKVNENSN